MSKFVTDSFTDLDKETNLRIEDGVVERMVSLLQHHVQNIKAKVGQDEATVDAIFQAHKDICSDSELGRYSPSPGEKYDGQLPHMTGLVRDDWAMSPESEGAVARITAYLVDQLVAGMHDLVAKDHEDVISMAHLQQVIACDEDFQLIFEEASPTPITQCVTIAFGLSTVRIDDGVAEGVVRLLQHHVHKIKANVGENVATAEAIFKAHNELCSTGRLTVMDRDGQLRHMTGLVGDDWTMSTESKGTVSSIAAKLVYELVCATEDKMRDANRDANEEAVISMAYLQQVISGDEDLPRLFKDAFSVSVATNVPTDGACWRSDLCHRSLHMCTFRTHSRTLVCTVCCQAPPQTARPLPLLHANLAICTPQA